MGKYLRLIPATSTLAGLVVLLGCGGEQQSQTQTPPAAQPAATAQAYPIDWCVVSGEKLGSMGDPVEKVYNDRTIKFCCAHCVETFEADQARYIARVDSAAAGQIMPPGQIEEHDHDHDGHEGHDHGA